jgi:hypothetical protein
MGMTQTMNPQTAARPGDFVRFSSDRVTNAMGQPYVTDWFKVTEINWYTPVSFHMIGRDGMPYTRFLATWEHVTVHPYSLKHNRER